MDFNQYDYDLTEIKENLDDTQIMDLLAELGGDPRLQNGIIVSRTICHCGQSHKLYYYPNTHLFKCYTDCGETFDAIELVRKVKSQELRQDFSLPASVEFIAQKYGFSKQSKENYSGLSIKEDLKYFNAYDRINNIDLNNQIVELKTYDDSFLKNLPQIDIIPWIEDNITRDTMNYYEIRYDPKNQGVVIPHKDINGNLIGIRERTLVSEIAEKYGKYLPMKMGKLTFNHPLSFNLYGLYQNKDNIRRMKKAIILESEKSVLQLDSILGRDSNIGVACCGSSVINYQVSLLQGLGVKEITIALDRQFQELNDKEHIKLVKNLKNIDKKYGNFIKIDYIFDKNKITPYKASPTDCGADIFLKLYKQRVNLY